MGYSIYKANSSKWATKFLNEDSEIQPFLTADFKSRLFFAQEEFVSTLCLHKNTDIKMQGVSCMYPQRSFSIITDECEVVIFHKTRQNVQFHRYCVFVVAYWGSLRNVTRFPGCTFSNTLTALAFINLRALSMRANSYTHGFAHRTYIDDRVGFREHGKHGRKRLSAKQTDL